MKVDKIFYVYCLKDDLNNIFYIGKGSGDRMFRHTQIAKSNSIARKTNPKLYNKISSIINNGKYIIPEILFKSESENECLKKEIQLIKEIDIKNLCNLTLGGEGTSGYKLTEEHKKKISIAKTGSKRTFSEEHKKKISESLSGDKHHKYWSGKKLSDETKLKMSLAKKGRKFSDEHRNNLSIAHKKK